MSEDARSSVVHPAANALVHLSTALRQFFSILLNAGIFGNFALIGFGGWLGGAFRLPWPC